MAKTLPAGAVAVNIVGDDAQFQQTINQVNKNIQKFQKNVNGITKMPGFQRGMALFRDSMVTFAAFDHVIRRYVLTPLKSAIQEFTTFGDTYAKMSRRVGMGAKDLSLLGYAAEQSGSSVYDLGTSFRYFNRNLAEASQGGKAAQDAFSKLDLKMNFNQFRGLDKKEQFLIVADAIRKLGNEAEQTKIAMKLFGRAGTSMLPMFQEGAAGIRALMKEADDLGIGISDKDAAKAEILSSSISRLQRSLQGLRRSIVTSLVEPVTQALDWCTKVTKNLREWVNANQAAVKSILKVGGALAGVGAAFAAWRFAKPLFMGEDAKIKKLTKLLWGLSTPLLGPLKLVKAAIYKSITIPIIAATIAATRFRTALIGAFLNPIGAIKGLGFILMGVAKAAMLLISPFLLGKAAIAGAVGAILYFTGAGTKLMSWLTGFGTKIKETFTSTFGDLVPLIQEGRILDAVKLMWLKIQLFFEEGKLAIMNKWNEVAAAISEPFMAIYETVSEAVKPAVEWLLDTFHGIGGWISDQFTGPMKWLCGMFGKWWGYIERGWDALMNDTGEVIVGTWWTIATKINEAWAWVRKKWNALITGIQTTLLGFLRELASQVNKAASWLDPTGYITSATSTAVAELDRMIKEIEDRGIQVDADIDTGKEKRQKALDEMALSSLNRVKKEKEEAPVENERIVTLKREIAELKKPLHKPGEKSRQITETAQRISQQGASAITQGTINKADILGGALAYMASEKDHTEDIADHTEKMVDLLTGISRKPGAVFG